MNVYNRFRKQDRGARRSSGRLRNLQPIATEKELAKLAGEWPGARLVEMWNGFAGVAPFTDLKPVKKLTDRKAAVARIWAAVQRLCPDVAQPASDVAPAKGKSKKSPAKPPRRARAQKGADESRSNKKAEVIALMKRAKGRNAGRNHGSDRMAGAHRARVR